MDTIVALSSGVLPAGIAVVRLSGPDAFPVAEKITGFTGDVWRQTREFKLSEIRDPFTSELLDRGLVLPFKAPHSFTGEDVVELHLHGSRAVVDYLLFSLSRMENVRIAEPGEYTRRAFVNGKMDLVATEALGDLIQAQTQSQRRLAHSTADGHLAALYAGWRDLVLRSRSMIEADIDFADEDDVPGSVIEEVFSEIPKLIDEIENQIKAAEVADRVREGFQIVIIGPPNAGKSSLLNMLAGREAAIVTEIPGTTRDTIEVQLNLGGFLVRVIDTAGIRSTSEVVEKIGIERAQRAASNADLVLNLSVDGTWISPERDMESHIAEIQEIKILTKSDLRVEMVPSDCDLAISAKTGAGMDVLLQKITEHVKSAAAVLGERAGGNRRQASKMQKSLLNLREVTPNRPLELNAESLRLAGLQLGELTGDIGNEEILGEIFSSFCIGK